jgi:hypothetical protein
MDNEKFEYFMEQTEKDLDHIKTRLDKLWDFRIMLLGGSILVSAVCSVALSLATVWLASKG